MKALDNLIKKYELKRKVVTQLIQNSKKEDDSSKELAVRRFLTEMIDDLKRVKADVADTESKLNLADVSGSLPLNKDAAIKMLNAFMKDTLEMLNGKRFAPSLKPENWFDEYIQRGQ